MLRFIHKMLNKSNSQIQLSIATDNIKWSLSEDAKQITKIANKIGIDCIAYSGLCKNTNVFFTDRYKMMNEIISTQNIMAKIYFPYYHGIPRRGEKIFDDFFDRLVRNHDKITRIQVTNNIMKKLLLEDAKIQDEKLHHIFIGIDTNQFISGSTRQKHEARIKFKIPQSAVVIGSFQKDGNGWGEGIEPKFIKGPDVLVKTLILLKRDISELFVFLVGPARGYVKNALTKACIPFRYVCFENFYDVSQCYHALDAYIVASREEGGPKAILESMATRTPIISTKVGQASELIIHEHNGWLADLEDSEALAYFAYQAISDTKQTKIIVDNAYATALENSYNSQIPLWKKFFS